MHYDSSRTRLRTGVALLALTAALAQATPALAEDTENLGKLVVSANRTATPINTVGSSVSVITGEEMEERQNYSVLDTLEETNSITHYGYTNRSLSSSDIMVRGLPGGNTVLITIDGVSMSTPGSLLGRTFDIGSMPADAVESVEFLRGSQSALYGSNAVSGVIAVNTKTGKNSTKPMKGSLTLESGTYNTYKSVMNAYGRIDDVYYGVTMSGLTTDGFNYSDLKGTGATDEKDGYRNQAMNYRI